MKIYFLIPARSGSKGIANKNIKYYNGKPLISWSIEQAQKSKHFNNNIFISTDSEEYKKICLQYNGVHCPFIRPSEISGDHSTDLDFFKHFIEYIEKSNIDLPDFIIQLRPTYPNRKVNIIDDIIDTFINNYNNYDSIRTVILNNNQTPYKMYNIENNKLLPLFNNINNINEPYNNCRQILPKTYLHNGYLDIVKTSVVKKLNSVSGNNIYPYILNQNEIDDIDNINDWISSENKKTKFIAEIGINHNGSVELCKKLIQESKNAGCDFVKIQKRNPYVCVPETQKNTIKDTPWGIMTYLDYKLKIEFSEEQIKELIDYSNSINISFFASVWDKDSVDIMSKYTEIGKIPSALINDIDLCVYARSKFKFLIISTGMSTEEEVENSIYFAKPDVIMHTNSTYPSPINELNLNYITFLKNKYNSIQLGYSGHETILSTTYAAIGLGATWIERHITSDKKMWGSDHKSSIDINELNELVSNIRLIESAMKFKPSERILFDSELSKKNSLRK